MLEIEEQLKMLRETQARTAANCEKMSEVLGAKDAEGLPLSTLLEAWESLSKA